ARFDHGAQYFSARSAQFARHLQQWQDAGWVEPWNPRLTVLGDSDGHSDPRGTHRFVAVPGMNGVCKKMAESLDCRFQTRAASIEFDGQWQIGLDDSDEVLTTQRLLITAPPVQTAELLGVSHPLHAELANIHLQPSIAAMISFNEPIDTGFDAAFVNNDNPINWIALDSSKPQRSGNHWVLHAGPEWSAAHLEQSFEELAELLLRAFDALFDFNLPEPSLCIAHRWRYALGHSEKNLGFLNLPEQRLAIAGDWLAGSRIEGAWSSGDKAANWLLEA
ncbi:MAG: FAD-dependent oxidoreductase, partial [Pseudomonadota bacterium]